MKALAEFEGYAEQFRVTEEALEKAWCEDPRPFEAFVAEGSTSVGLLGMAITYQQPWTYDLRPTVVLKELFVVPEGRGYGVGAELMSAVIEEAKTRGASRINWTVLADNDRAKDFYRRLSGKHDAKWEPWTLELP